VEIRNEKSRKILKTRNTFLAAVVLGMLSVSSCATLKTSAVEQEELIAQIQKEQATSPVPQAPGRWVDANGWEYEGLSPGGGPD